MWHLGQDKKIVVFKTPSDWQFCHPPLKKHHLEREQSEGKEFDI